MAQSAPGSSSFVGVGIVLVLCTAFISGVSTFVNGYAVHGTNSAAFVTARNLVVALFLIPLALLARRALARPLQSSEWARLVAIGIIGGAIPFLLFFKGLALASAAGGGLTASFVYRTLFLMATVFGVVALHERFQPRIVLAAVLLLAGNYLLLTLTTPLWTTGTLYVFVATVMWAVEYSISKRTLRDLPAGVVAMGRMGIGGVVLVGYLAATAQLSAVGALSPGQWDWVLISAVLLTAFVATWYTGLRRVDLGIATSVLVLGFPITWALSVLVNGSSFTLDQAVGAAAIVVGAVLAVGLGLWRAAWTAIQQGLHVGARASA